VGKTGYTAEYSPFPLFPDTGGEVNSATTMRSAGALFAAAAAALLVLAFPVTFSAQEPQENLEKERVAIQLIPELKHDVSVPLAELDRMTPPEPHRFSPRLLKILPTGPPNNAPEVAEPDRTRLTKSYQGLEKELQESKKKAK